MKRHNIVLILIVAIGLVFRIGLAHFMPGALSNDAQSYYKSAINVVEGRGYSERVEPPYYPFFFREPLTTYSIAATMYVVKNLMDVEHLDFPQQWTVSEMSVPHQEIIFWVRIVSDLLQIGALLLFYNLLLRYSSRKFAMAFLCISMLYFPLAFYCTLLLREVYVFFLLALITWLWERYVYTHRRIYFVFTALALGVLLQYLHLYWLMILFFIPTIWWCRRETSIIKRLGSCVVFIVTMFLPSASWVAHVYNYYPDIKVVRTLGAGLSAEYTNNLNAYRALGYDPYYVKQGDIPGNVEVRTDIFLPDDVAKVFDYTFDGTYSREAARLNSYNTTERLLSYYAGRVVEAFRNTVFIVGITYDYGIFRGQYTLNDIAKFMFCLPFLFMGVLALCGAWPVFRRYWFLMPAFCYHAVFFAAYGDEERRTYVMIPYIIVFALAFVTWAKYKLEKYE